jgi:hypothetical protein
MARGRPDLALKDSAEDVAGDPGNRSPDLASTISELRHSEMLRSGRRSVFGFRFRQAGDTQENRGLLDRLSGPYIQLQRGAPRTRSFQMQLALSHTILNRHRVLRPGARCAAAVILLTAWSGIPATALAQSAPLPQINAQGPMNAPIGHRQPRAQDLPPDVLRHEGMNQQPAVPAPAPTTPPDGSRDQVDGRADRTPSVDDGASRTPSVDDDLKICRQC